MFHLRDDIWVHIGNFAHDFSTGPPMAGLFAVFAAFVALRGIKRQVAETREANQLSKDANRATDRANAETVRKNTEDQWWSALQWAYSEAKAFKENNASETRAVVAILSSLAEQKDLSDLQVRTVAEVLGMFKESSDELVLEAVDTALDFLGSNFLGPFRGQGGARSTYEQSVGRALLSLTPKFGALAADGHVAKPRGGHRFDYVLRAYEGDLVGIDVRFSPMRLGSMELPPLSRLIGLSVGWINEPEHNSAPPPARKISKVLVITNQDVNRWENSPYSKGDLIAAVKWDLDDPVGGIEAALNRLTKPGG